MTLTGCPLLRPCLSSSARKNASGVFCCFESINGLIRLGDTNTLNPYEISHGAPQICNSAFPVMELPPYITKLRLPCGV